MEVKEILEDVIRNRLQMRFYWADQPEADKILEHDKIVEPVVIADFAYPMQFERLRTGALVEIHQLNIVVLQLMDEYDTGQNDALHLKKRALLKVVHRIYNQMRFHEEIRDRQAQFPTVSDPREISGNFSVHEIGWRFRLRVPFQPECGSGVNDLLGNEVPYQNDAL